MLERVELSSVALERVDLTVEDEQPSPLEAIEYSDDIEADCAKEFAVVETEFQKRASDEQKRFQKATDSEFWVCLCFQTREQCEEFLAKCGHAEPDEKYVDGVKFARLIGKPVTPDETPFGKTKIDPTWSKMARKVKPNGETQEGRKEGQGRQEGQQGRR